VKSSGAALSAAGEAKEQLRQTLNDSRFAAYPNDSVFSRLWLNRIVEAAVGVSRENRFRLSEDDLAALDAFRRGEGTLEWAGLGMIAALVRLRPRTIISIRCSATGFRS
jgi:hypothetical protein